MSNKDTYQPHHNVHSIKKRHQTTQLPRTSTIPFTTVIADETVFYPLSALQDQDEAQ